jgi:phenylalanyl-tRNA synthetase beta chain
MLHPNLEKQLGFDQRVYLVELDQSLLLGREVPRFKPLSRYPSVRRDIALIVDADLPIGHLAEAVRQQGGSLLRDVAVFDVYRGPGVEDGQKSVALALVWQDEQETLTDSRVEAAVAQVLDMLGNRFNAHLRD